MYNDRLRARLRDFPPTGDAPTARSPHTATILVVEDDARVRRLIVRTLRKEGLTILEADTAEAGLAVFLEDRGTIDLTIIDMILPVMSGLDLAAELKRQHGLERRSAARKQTVERTSPE